VEAVPNSQTAYLRCERKLLNDAHVMGSAADASRGAFSSFWNSSLLLNTDTRSASALAMSWGCLGGRRRVGRGGRAGAERGAAEA
jgi:hypothetical protein